MIILSIVLTVFSISNVLGRRLYGVYVENAARMVPKKVMEDPQDL